MIAEITYSKPLKKRVFAVPENDIWNGKYREAFLDIFRALKPDDLYHVEEYRGKGLVLRLPQDVTVRLPVIHFDRPNSAVTMKEVFEKCQEAEEEG